MPDDVTYVSAVTKTAFNPASLTGAYQPMNGVTGFTDSVKVWKLYNGSTTASIDISFDGVNDHDFIPPSGTCIIDFQTNHSNVGTYSNGTWNLRKGQVIYGKTAANPTFLQIIGYK